MIIFASPVHPIVQYVNNKALENVMVNNIVAQDFL